MTTIPSESLAELQTQGWTWIAVKGDCLHCGPRVEWHHEMDCGDEPTLPPAVFVEATQPCAVDHLAHAKQCGCLDDSASCCAAPCHNGKRLLAVTGPCLTCWGEGWRPRMKEQTSNSVTYYVHLTDPCPDCSAGSVSVSVTVAEVLPITNEVGDKPPTSQPPLHALNGKPAPGGWAVKLEVAK